MQINIVLLTYKKLDTLAKEAIKKHVDNSITISFIEGVRDELLNDVLTSTNIGTDIFIAGGANYSVIHSKTNVPIVRLRASVFDYIEAVIEASKISKNIGVVYYKKNPKNIEAIFDVLNFKPKIITYKNTTHLKRIIKERAVEVIVGASLSNEIAEELGLKSVLVYSGVNTIINAIRKAKNIVINIHNQKRQEAFLKSIIKYTSHGIIEIDEEGKVINYNDTAEKILKKTKCGVLQSSVDASLPDIKLKEVFCIDDNNLSIVSEIQNGELHVEKIPLKYNNKILGAVAVITYTDKHYSAEKKKHTTYSKAGFKARNIFDNIASKSLNIKEVLTKTKLFAQTDKDILILGESGVGKELFAQSIHNYSERKNGPFVAINCAALPDELLESELFGYEEGAFTGTKKGGKEGLFELASGGTLFLDEIGEISPALQVRLLRVLQEREIFKLGGNKIIPTNARVISSTNKAIAPNCNKTFRTDLYYRLSSFEITVPPLRERQEDIRDLFIHYYKQQSTLSLSDIEEYVKNSKIFDIYSFRGNIRELINIASRFSVFWENSKRSDYKSFKESLIESFGIENIIKDILMQENIYDMSKKIPESILKKIVDIMPCQTQKICHILNISRTTLWRKKSNTHNS